MRDRTSYMRPDRMDPYGLPGAPMGPSMQPAAPPPMRPAAPPQAAPVLPATSAAPMPAQPVVAPAAQPQTPPEMAPPEAFAPEAVPEQWAPNFADFLAAGTLGFARQKYEPAGRDYMERERAAALQRNAQGQAGYDARKADFERWMRMQTENERHNKAMESRPGSMPFVATLDRNPDSDASKRADMMARQFGYDGPPLSEFEADRWRPGINQQASIAAGRAGRAETFQNQKSMAYLQERMRRDAELRAEGRTLEKEDRDAERERQKEARALRVANDARAVTFANDYEKANRDYLQMAGMAQDMRDVVGEDGSVDPGIMASLNSRFATYFNGEKVTNLNAAKRMLLEKWSRTQTGAAISETEEEKFARQVGSDPYASEEDINAAFDTMERTIARTLRAGATGNPDAARAVADNAGLNEGWLANVKGIASDDAPDAEPGTEIDYANAPDEMSDGRPFPELAPDAPKPKRKAAPKPKAAAPAAAPQQERTVKAVESATDAEGNRVQVVFYSDGSHEVVKQ